MRNFLRFFFLLLIGLYSRSGIGVDEIKSSSPFTGTKAYVGPVLGIASGKTGYGFNVGACKKFFEPLPILFGLETGYLHRKYPAFNVSMFPILLTATYSLDEVFGFQHIHPYLGAAAGIEITPGAMSSLSTRVNTEYLLRPGVLFRIAEDWNITLEPRIGLIQLTFFFMPQLAVEFQL